MKVIEVNTPELDHSFVIINALINKDNPNYIRPLDNEVLDTFNPTKNKLFKALSRNNYVPSIGVSFNELAIVVLSPVFVFIFTKESS